MALFVGVLYATVNLGWFGGLVWVPMFSSRLLLFVLGLVYLIH